MQINKKKVIKTITVEESEYVAFDGRIFTTEEECLAYEDTHKNIEAIFNNIEVNHELDGCFPLNGCEASEEHSYFWFRPKTEAEVDALNAYYGANNYDRIGVDAINQWICVELDYEDAYWGYTLLSDCMEHTRGFFGNCGYDVSFSEHHEKCSDYDSVLRSAMNWEAEDVADSADLLEIFRDHWGLSNEDLKTLGYEYLLDLQEA